MQLPAVFEIPRGTERMIEVFLRKRRPLTEQFHHRFKSADVEAALYALFEIFLNWVDRRMP